MEAGANARPFCDSSKNIKNRGMWRNRLLSFHGFDNYIDQDKKTDFRYK